MWTIDLFVKDNGRCPTQDFLDELSPSADRPYIRKRFEQLEEHGYKLIARLRLTWVTVFMNYG